MKKIQMLSSLEDVRFFIGFHETTIYKVCGLFLHFLLPSFLLLGLSEETMELDDWGITFVAGGEVSLI